MIVGPKIFNEMNDLNWEGGQATDWIFYSQIISCS